MNFGLPLNSAFRALSSSTSQFDHNILPFRNSDSGLAAQTRKPEGNDTVEDVLALNDIMEVLPRERGRLTIIHRYFHSRVRTLSSHSCVHSTWMDIHDSHFRIFRRDILKELQTSQLANRVAR